MFQQTGSQQKNAAPLQSFVKKAGGVQGANDPNASMKSPSTPRANPPSAGQQAQPMMPTVPFDPVFMQLAMKFFMGMR